MVNPCFLCYSQQAMIKKTARYVWTIRAELTKYVIVGGSGVFLDMGTLILFKERFGLIPVVAVVLNQALLLAYNFTLNKYWSFRNTAIPHWQLARYMTLAAANYVVAVSMMQWLHHGMEFDYRLVRLGTIALTVSWNFLLYKYWVYRR